MFKPHRTLGQNFLSDKTIAKKMVSALEITKDDVVIEIGPGKGVLTAFITEIPYKKFHAVEVDRRLYLELVEKYKDTDNLEIHCDDILQWLPKFSIEGTVKVIASVPYYITSPIIHQLIKMKNRPTTAVLLIQKEVAEKIKSTAPDSSYMSSFTQTFFNVDYLGKVSAKDFWPVPEVDGGILKLSLKNIDIPSEFVRKYEGFLHRAYSNPRKMLNKVFKKDELEKGKIEPTLRAQNLDAEEWFNFYKVLNEV